MPKAAVTLAQSVTDRLRAALLEGRFGPEEKLNEESLSAMLQVSRTPVRSALHGLAAEGLLDYVPNRGYSVRSVDRAQLNAIFDVRGVLEGLAARLAAQRGLSETQQAGVVAALQEGDRVMAKGRLLVADRPVFSSVNARFHAGRPRLAAPQSRRPPPHLRRRAAARRRPRRRPDARARAHRQAQARHPAGRRTRRDVRAAPPLTPATGMRLAPLLAVHPLAMPSSWRSR